MPRFDVFHHPEDRHHYRAGEHIFQQGDDGEYLYDIVQDEVTLERDNRTLTTLTQGDIFGEVTLINNTRHSVSAIAKVDCEIAQISKKRFLFMVDQTPNFAIRVMQVLAERLAQETAKHD